jgi:hypothetical protein
MKRNVFLMLALVGVLVLGPVSAGAVLVNFAEFANGQNIDGLLIGDASPNHVTITSANHDTVIYDRWTSYPNGVTNGGFLIGNPMTFTFEVPRGVAGFTGGDAGGDQDRFVVKAYDINGVLLATVDTGVFGGNSPLPFPYEHYMVDQFRIDFTTIGFIKTMVVEAFSVAGGAGIVIDDLTYCHPAPIPGSLLLLGSGILGLVGVGMRRKSSH